VLILRRKASPTETELQDQFSQMVDEALEMVIVEPRPGETLDSSIPTLQSVAQPEP
jgi:hypothetical protein